MQTQVSAHGYRCVRPHSRLPSRWRAGRATDTRSECRRRESRDKGGAAPVVPARFGVLHASRFVELCVGGMPASTHIPLPEHFKNCVKENFAVEPEAEILDVPDVAVDALPHGRKGRSFSTEPVYLRPSGDPWTHGLPVQVMRNSLRIVMVMAPCMRPRANEPHLT